MKLGFSWSVCQFAILRTIVNNLYVHYAQIKLKPTETIRYACVSLRQTIRYAYVS